MAFNTLSFMKRATVAVIGGPLILGAFYFGGIPLLIFIEAIIAVGAWEYYRISRQKGLAPAAGIGIVLSMLISLRMYYAPHFVPLILIGAVMLFFMHEVVRKEKKNIIENAAIGIFGVIYLGYLPGHMLLFHTRSFNGTEGLIPGGAYWLPLIIVSIWIFDTACYLLGSWLGKHKLFPTISPNKTWEGLAGGIVALIAVSPLLFMVVRDYAVWYDYIAVPVLIGLLALLGDLFESVLKRDGGVKDSSSIIPGHGGVLDRFDSMIIVVPVLYWYLYITKVLIV